MKLVHRLALAATLVLAVTAAASAQTVRLKVTVPFRFTVNHTTLPAGEYSVKTADNGGTEMLAIYNLNSKTTHLILSDSCQSVNAAGQTRLVFHRYGKRNFLSQIWIKGNNAGREFRPGAEETEVARNFAMQRVLVAADQ